MMEGKPCTYKSGEDVRGVFWRNPDPLALPVEESAAAATPQAQSDIKRLAATTLATEKAFADGPSRLDPDKTLAAMSLRKRRSPTQVCRDNFDAKSKESILWRPILCCV